MSANSKPQPKGRSLTEFQPLFDAEQKLLQACGNGDTASFGNQTPRRRTKANSIRGSFIRFIVVSCDPTIPVHAHGVRIKGAWIEGNIDLENCQVPKELTLSSCT